MVMATAIRWLKWKCSMCDYHLADYDPDVPCHLCKKCPRCKATNVLDRRKDAVQ